MYPPCNDNVKVVPLNVKFGFARSRTKDRYKNPFKDVEAGHKSFYEANYEPLNILYKIKTGSKN
jgi:hypothetical protein